MIKHKRKAPTSRRRKATIDRPIIVGPDDILHDYTLVPAHGYKGPSVRVVDAGYKSGGFALIDNCDFDGFTTDIEIVGKVDVSRFNKCNFSNSGTSITTTPGAVWRESWVTDCHWSKCDVGLSVDGTLTVGDNHNQLTIEAPHMSWVGQPLMLRNGRRDRPMRRMRVLGGMIHGPRLDEGEPLVVLDGNLRDVRVVNVDMNNGSHGQPGVLITAPDGVPAPTVVSIEVNTANMRGDGIEVVRGRQVSLYGNINGVAGRRVVVHVEAQVHDHTNVWS